MTGKRRIAGVDEVGRGPLAGAVVAAAVILDDKNPISGLTDSKLLTPKKRDYLFEIIKEKSLAWALGRAEVEEIDAINIFQASLLAMQRAVEQLNLQPDHLLVDGKHCPQTAYTAQAIIKGDQIEPAISAASIIAKVSRDREMQDLSEIYPEYGLAKHKGYATAQHLAALEAHGPSPIHRRSFAPLKHWLADPNFRSSVVEDTM